MTTMLRIGDVRFFTWAHGTTAYVAAAIDCPVSAEVCRAALERDGWTATVKRGQYKDGSPVHFVNLEAQKSLR